MIETEQKLIMSKGDLEKVFQALAPKTIKKKHHPRAYYDTPDMQLDQRRVALRIQKKKKNGYKQTIKAAMENDGASLVRYEWAFKIAEHKPDKSAIDNPETLKAVEGIDFSQLLHLFTSDVKRRYFDIELEDGTVEIAFDLGQISLPGSDVSEELCEIEVELKSGNPAVIDQVVRQIQDIAPAAEISMRSKAERGMNLYRKHRL